MLANNAAQLDSVLRNDIPSFFSEFYILGLTVGWGRVIEQDYGYRVSDAEHVGIVVFAPDPDWRPRRLPKAWRKVPIFRVPHMEDAVPIVEEFSRGETFREVPASELVMPNG